MDIIVMAGLSVMITGFFMVVCFLSSYISSINIARNDLTNKKYPKHELDFTNDKPRILFFNEKGKIIGACRTGKGKANKMMAVAFSYRIDKPHDFNVYKRAWRFCLFGLVFTRFKHYERYSMLFGSYGKPPKKTDK